MCWLVSPRNHIEVKKKHKINSNKCSIGWCNLFPMRINQWNGKNSRKFIAWEIKLFNRFFFLQSWSTFTSIFNTKYLITIGKKTVFFYTFNCHLLSMPSFHVFFSNFHFDFGVLWFVYLFIDLFNFCFSRGNKNKLRNGSFCAAMAFGVNKLIGDRIDIDLMISKPFPKVIRNVYQKSLLSFVW